MKGLKVFIARTDCWACGGNKPVVRQRYLFNGSGPPKQEVLKEICMDCKLARATQEERNHWRSLWKRLWAEAGGKDQDMPAVLRDDGARALPPPPVRTANPGPCAGPLPPVRVSNGWPEALPVPTPPPPPRRPLRVLFASHALELSGGPIILGNIVPRLRGIDARVYCPSDGDLWGWFRFQGVPVERQLDLAGIDLVVANTLLSAPVIEAARQANVPCVWMIHEYDASMCGNIDAVRDLIHYPHAVIFPHQSTADGYAMWRTKGVHVIPTVIPPVPIMDRQWARLKLKIDEGDFIALTFGRDEPRKGQRDLKEAVAGTGIRAICRGGQADPYPYLAAADVYVCCSRVEAFPLSLQEAKAYRLPVITTPLPGCTAIIRPGIDGLSYEVGNVHELREKLQAIRTDARLREQLSQPLTHLPSFGDTLADYERVFQTAAGRAIEAPLHVVYHIASMGKLWTDIVGEQIETLAAAGLNRVLCTHVGDGIDWCLDHARRHGLELVIADHRERLDHYERPAIELIQRLVRMSDKPVLYLHSKGVSHQDPGSMHHNWRRLMMKGVVSRWRENLTALADHDAVGVNWWDMAGLTHFSGNFWMATAAWLRSLPDLGVYWRDRYSAERWIGSRPGCRARSIFCKDAAFWSKDRDLFEALCRQELGEQRQCATVYD